MNIWSPEIEYARYCGRLLLWIEGGCGAHPRFNVEWGGIEGNMYGYCGGRDASGVFDEALYTCLKSYHWARLQAAGRDPVLPFDARRTVYRNALNTGTLFSNIARCAWIESHSGHLITEADRVALYVIRAQIEREDDLSIVNALWSYGYECAAAGRSRGDDNLIRALRRRLVNDTQVLESGTIAGWATSRYGHKELRAHTTQAMELAWIDRILDTGVVA